MASASDSDACVISGASDGMRGQWACATESTQGECVNRRRPGSRPAGRQGCPGHAGGPRGYRQSRGFRGRPPGRRRKRAIGRSRARVTVRPTRPAAERIRPGGGLRRQWTRSLRPQGGRIDRPGPGDGGGRLPDATPAAGKPAGPRIVAQSQLRAVAMGPGRPEALSQRRRARRVTRRSEPARCGGTAPAGGGVAGPRTRIRARGGRCPAGSGGPS